LPGKPAHRLPGSHAPRRLPCVPGAAPRESPPQSSRLTPAGAGQDCADPMLRAGPAADGRRRPGAVCGGVRRVCGPAGGARGGAGAVDAAAERGLRAEPGGRAGVGALPAPGARPGPPARRRAHGAPGAPAEPSGQCSAGSVLRGPPACPVLQGPVSAAVRAGWTGACAMWRTGCAQGAHGMCSPLPAAQGRTPRKDGSPEARRSARCLLGIRLRAPRWPAAQAGARCRLTRRAPGGRAALSRLA